MGIGTMYRSLSEDARWCLIQAEIKVKLEDRVGGITDALLIGDGQYLFIVNVDTFGEVFGYYTNAEKAVQQGVDIIVEHFSRRLAENRKKQP